MRNITLIIILALLAAFPCQAMGGGTLGPGLLYINRADHMWARGEPRIESLDKAPEASSYAIAMLMLEFTVGDGNDAPLGSGFSGQPPKHAYREIYVGAPPSEWGRIGVGIKDYRPGRGKLKGFIHIVPYREEWENPYLTGVDRTLTESLRYGADVEWTDIMDTGWALGGKYEAIDINSDLIGEAEPDLRRDGAQYDLKASYKFNVASSFSIAPGITRRRAVMDGEANSFESMIYSLEMKYFKRKYIADLRVFKSSAQYDKAHPLFGEVREDTGTSALLFVVFPGAFGNKNVSATVGGMYGESDSNITFFDTHQSMGFLSVGFRI